MVKNIKFCIIIHNQPHRRTPIKKQTDKLTLIQTHHAKGQTSLIQGWLYKYNTKKIDHQSNLTEKNY